MKKLFTSLFMIILVSGYAQTGKQVADSLKKVQVPAADCQPAKDSLKKRLARGEYCFYRPLKYQPDQCDFITITKTKYSKVVYPKGYPSAGFISCYNKENKKVLDSVFKVDFSKKADSILASYDLAGKGYRNADFPGGAGVLQKFMDKNVSLPNDVKPDDSKLFILVYYSFIIDEKGNLSDIKLIKSNCKACEGPVLSAIKKMPAFIPATDAGKGKKVKYILPFTKAN